MYVTNLDETIMVLRHRLPDYLATQLGKKFNPKHRFPCFVHGGDDPNMGLDPNGMTRAKCFSHGCSADIFVAANHFENLAMTGPQWVTETIPHLCNLLEIPLSTGTPSPLDLEKTKFYKLANDITTVLEQAGDESGYAAKRNWEQQDITLGSITEEKLMRGLGELGHDAKELAICPMIRTAAHSYFGKDKLTFVIRDERGRPIAFQYRNLSENGPKYMNTPDTPIYQKGKVLMGLDTALKSAKQKGLYVVEGPGDLAQLRRCGVENSAATCGTAFTLDHLIHLKALGIKQLFFSLDWDEAGVSATDRIFFNVLNQTTGVSAFVVTAPQDESKDADEYLKEQSDGTSYTSLIKVPAFQWALTRLSNDLASDVVCERMVPLIAAEPTAIRREVLIKQLAAHTELSFHSILKDVESLRNGKFEERRARLLAAADEYKSQVEEDPDNLLSIFATHEQRIQLIEKEFNREIVGAAYQMQRYETTQTLRDSEDDSLTGFRMSWFREFAAVLSDGLPWSTGCLMYAGGRANSGKTATCLMIATDIANSDEDAIVLIHTTDDSYIQIEPRIKSNLARMLYPHLRIPIGAMVKPRTILPGLSQEMQEAHRVTNERTRELLSDDRLALIDAEDGSTLTVLERNIRYYRSKYPSRKIFVIGDNTHNYRDFGHLDATNRITQISNSQKEMTAKYQLCMLSTAEYRKNMPRDPSKLTLPVDDDLADARALMFRPNIIFHVYNDVHDRKEHAEIFWRDENAQVRPRLMLNFTKNKLTEFKDKLTLDLDPKTVTMIPVGIEQARVESAEVADEKAAGTGAIYDGKYVVMESDYEKS